MSPPFGRARPPRCTCKEPLEVLGGGLAIRCPQCKAIQLFNMPQAQLQPGGIITKPVLVTIEVHAMPREVEQPQEVKR